MYLFSNLSKSGKPKRFCQGEMNIFSQKQMEDIASGIWYTCSWPDFRQALNKSGASVQIPRVRVGMAGLKAITN